VERAKDTGLAVRDTAAVQRFVGALLRAARSGGPDYERLKEAFSEAKAQPWFSTLHIASLPSEAVLLKYGRTLSYDPDSAWRRVRVPTLLIYGDRDQRRLVTDSRTRILSALAQSRAHVDAPVYSGADHFIKVVDSLGASVFAAGFFDKQAQWIHRH
jgi:pimeloyl-ACP methyl ester carboxylesterase